MTPYFLKKRCITLVILFQTVGLLQAAEHNLTIQPPSLQELAMRVLMENLKKRGEAINSANYTDFIEEETTLCAQMWPCIAKMYTKRALTNFGLSQAPFSLKRFVFKNRSPVTSILLTDEGQLYATNKSRQLCEIDIESQTSTSIKLPTNGRDLALSLDGRFLAVLMQNRKMFIWDKEKNIQKVFNAPIIRSLGGQRLTSLKKIAFDPADNSLVCSIHNRRDRLHLSIQELFSDAPEGKLQEATPMQMAQKDLPRIFCGDSKIFIHTRYNRQTSICTMLLNQRPLTSSFSSDYSHLAIGMENGVMSIWHFPNTLYYLLKCAVENTLESKNPEAYSTLSEILTHEQSGPFAQLPSKVKSGILFDLETELKELLASRVPRSLDEAQSSTSGVSGISDSLSRKHTLDVPIAQYVQRQRLS